MKKFFTITVIALSLSFVFTGCSHRLTDFTIISTKNVELSKANTFKRGSSRVEGVDRVHIILSVPTGRPNLKEAIDRAIEETPGAVALLDGVVYVKGWSAILYGQSKVVIEGSPLLDPSIDIVSGSGDLQEYTVATLDRSGEIKEISEISKSEYTAMKAGIVKDSQKKNFRNSSGLK